MKKRLPLTLYAAAGLLPALGVFWSIGFDQSLCDFARDRVACFRGTSLAASWWKLAFAAALGWAVAAGLRLLAENRRRYRAGYRPRFGR